MKLKYFIVLTILVGGIGSSSVFAWPWGYHNNYSGELDVYNCTGSKYPQFFFHGKKKVESFSEQKTFTVNDEHNNLVSQTIAFYPTKKVNNAQSCIVKFDNHGTAVIEKQPTNAGFLCALMSPQHHQYGSHNSTYVYKLNLVAAN